MAPALRRVVLFAGLLATATPSRADSQTHTVVVGPIPVGGSATATLPRFDGSLGVLRNVHVEIPTRVSGTLAFENTTGQPVTVGGYAGGHNLGMLVPAFLNGALVMPPMNPGFIPPAVDLAAYDGTTDYAGPSGVTHVFVDETADGYPTGTRDFYADAGLQAFFGSGTVSLVLGPTQQIGPNAPPGVSVTGTVAADATVRVRYDYSPYPTEICVTQSQSGCPCGWSLMGYACPNSANPGGGGMSFAGTASLANDTLVLSGFGMTPVSTVLYFQGTSMVHAQIPYGDGLRCVTGTLVRIGQRTNAGGASSYPGPGDPTISQRGGIVAPGTRYYQASYRDPAAFCTAATFNATRGVAIAWGP
jgi:hypothetical protein